VARLDRRGSVEFVGLGIAGVHFVARLDRRGSVEFVGLGTAGVWQGWTDGDQLSLWD